MGKEDNMAFPDATMVNSTNQLAPESAELIGCRYGESTKNLSSRSPRDELIGKENKVFR
jgi:hypothetical protein